MKKKNCWEYKNCGRQPGGHKVDELGVCPAATEALLNGINCGKNGGRACWAIVGTFCGGEIQGTYSAKINDCMQCEFYKEVFFEEGPDYVHSEKILKKVKKKAKKKA